MPDERQRRLALNESAFRVANERMEEWPERRERTDRATFYCECATLACRDRIELTPAEYQRVRSSSRQFAVVPGHEMLDVEDVIERTDGYVIVQKLAGVTPLVARSDPRNS